MGECVEVHTNCECFKAGQLAAVETLRETLNHGGEAMMLVKQILAQFTERGSVGVRCVRTGWITEGVLFEWWSAVHRWKDATAKGLKVDAD